MHEACRPVIKQDVGREGNQARPAGSQARKVVVREPDGVGQWENTPRVRGDEAATRGQHELSMHSQNRQPSAVRPVVGEVGEGESRRFKHSVGHV